ncbi:GOSR2/Membrin/Bos1, partial [Kipferlia bialata]
ANDLEASLADMPTTLQYQDPGTVETVTSLVIAGKRLHDMVEEYQDNVVIQPSQMQDRLQNKVEHLRQRTQSLIKDTRTLECQMESTQQRAQRSQLINEEYLQGNRMSVAASDRRLNAQLHTFGRELDEITEQAKDSQGALFTQGELIGVIRNKVIDVASLVAVGDKTLGDILSAQSSNWWLITILVVLVFVVYFLIRWLR